MNKQKIIALGITLLCGLLMLGGGVWAMTSTNYAINWDVIGGGGEPASSDNYAARSTIGQPAAETSFSTNYQLGSGYWQGIVPSEPGPNQAPYEPSGPLPEDGATNVSIPVTLSVLVSDPDGDNMDVTFYDASDSSEIGTDTSVDSGDRAEVTWSGLANDTEYSWYAEARDAEYYTISATWSFITGAEGGDILAYYRGLGSDPNVVETPDLLQAINDWANGEIPPGFSQAISTTQLLQLIGEWAMGP